MSASDLFDLDLDGVIGRLEERLVRLNKATPCRKSGPDPVEVRAAKRGIGRQF